MPTINLDEIIHYQPPVPNSRSKVPQSSCIYRHEPSGPGHSSISHSNLTQPLEGVIPNQGFPLNHVRPMEHSPPVPSQCPVLNRHSAIESEKSISLVKPNEQVTLDLSCAREIQFQEIIQEDEPINSASDAYQPNIDTLGILNGMCLPGKNSTNCDEPTMDSTETSRGSERPPSQVSRDMDSDRRTLVPHLNLLSMETTSTMKEISQLPGSEKVATEITPDITTDYVDASLSDRLSGTSKEHDSLSVSVVDVTISDRRIDIELCEPGFKSPAALTNEGILESSEISGDGPITKQHKNIQSEINELTATDVEREPVLDKTRNTMTPRGAERVRPPSPFISPSPDMQMDGEKSPSRTARQISLALDPGSIAITPSPTRQREGGSPSPPTTRHSQRRKRCRLPFGRNKSSSESSSDLDDGEDANYISEDSMVCRRARKARQGIRHVAPRMEHNGNTCCNRLSSSISVTSSNGEGQSDVTMTRRPGSSLSDRETIPIRGFLTRDILLSKVIYSITFEEHHEQPRHRQPGGNLHRGEREDRCRNPPQQNKARPKKSFQPIGSLSKDDELLVKLKEERGLTWKQIGEHFPQRSVGSLQVRYSTRLKNRGGRSSMSSQISKAQKTASGGPCLNRSPKPVGRLVTKIGDKTAGLSAQRYRPRRRRQPVSRYSPA